MEGRALPLFYLQHLYISGHLDLALAGPPVPPITLARPSTLSDLSFLSPGLV